MRNKIMRWWKKRRKSASLTHLQCYAFFAYCICCSLWFRLLISHWCSAHELSSKGLIVISWRCDKIAIFRTSPNLQMTCKIIRCLWLQICNRRWLSNLLDVFGFYPLLHNWRLNGFDLSFEGHSNNTWQFREGGN